LCLTNPQDELTLDNMSRPQLASMCVYMGLRPYGADNFLRFQLRAKLRNLKDDDQRIVWEGIDNMNKEELREACRVRACA
jgi:LETM1 and EF-hand domain-containing protein 1, mitochondrial